MKDKSHRVKHLAFSEGFPASFPREWFNAHPNGKPKIVIFKAMDLASARNSVFHGLRKSLEPSLAVTYLYRIMETHALRSENEWKSYGLTIDEVDVPVHLGNLFEVK